MAKFIYNKTNIIKYAAGEISKKALMRSYNDDTVAKMNDWNEIEKAGKVRAAQIGKRQMEVIYIKGPAGSGKTTWAKYLAEKQGYDYVLSSGGEHMFDEYDGEECLILDDMRAGNMRFSDFLKLLDPNHSSAVAARYHNKNMDSCKLLIITNTAEPWNFYRFFNDLGDNGPKEQFYRRISHTYYEIGIDDPNHPFKNVIVEHNFRSDAGLIGNRILGTMEEVYNYLGISEEDIKKKNSEHSIIKKLYSTDYSDVSVKRWEEPDDEDEDEDDKIEERNDIF